VPLLLAVAADRGAPDCQVPPCARRDRLSSRPCLLSRLVSSYLSVMVFWTVPPLTLEYFTVMSPDPFTRYWMVRVALPGC
jgi:hypothetical protein